MKVHVANGDHGRHAGNHELVEFCE
jgi:hypothetical protein